MHAKHLILAGTALLAIPSLADSSPPAPTPPSFAQLAGAIDAAIDKGVPSLVVVVFDQRQILWSHAAGFADANAKRPPTLDTRYRTGSMAKAVTSTVLAIASQRHFFSFDAKIPVATVDGNIDVTAGKAVNMQAGLAQAVCYQGITGDRDHLCSRNFDRDFAVTASSGGGRYSYSNMGPQIAADTLSAHLHQPFETIASRLLFGPAGMNETTYNHSQAATDRAKSYEAAAKPYKHDFMIMPSAGAGLETSARDLVRFGQLHLGRGSLLKTRSLRLLHSAPNDGFYGYGWGRIGAGKDTEVLISDGQVNGGQAMLILSPHYRAGAVVIANAARDEVSQLAIAAIDLVAPGTARAFDADVGAMQAAHDAKAAAFLPSANFEGVGVIRVGASRLPLSARANNDRLDIVLAGRSSDQSESSTDEGFRGWSIPCPSVVPACGRPGATAKLWLTKDHGGLSGQLLVTSFNGQLPYPVRLQLH